MNKRKINGRFWTAIGLSVAMLCGAIFAGGGYLLNSKNEENGTALPSVSAGADMASDLGITYPNGNSDLGRLPNGFQYMYTDASLITAMHNQTATNDMLTVTVDATAAVGVAGATWGTKKTDPYVIASLDDWEIFVQKIAKDSTHGAGKFYVLASSLDFSSETFHMVGTFQGTFYGLGFTLKNIECSNWEVYNANTSQYQTITASFNPVNGGFGVFGKLQDATVADLCVENFSFTDVPVVQSLGSWIGPSIGGIAGVSYGTRVHVLNCQTSGEMAHLLFSISGGGSTFSWPAGILGSNIATNLYIYRCSADVDINAPTSGAAHPTAGGIIGEVWQGTSCYVYDCAANARVTITTSTTYSHLGAAVGWANGYIYIENFVGSVEISYTTDVRPNSGALGGSNYATPHKNIYCDGKQGALNLVPWTTNLGSFSNGNFVKSGSSYHVSNSSSYLDVPAANQFSSRSALLTAAKNAVGNTAASLPSAIWDAEKITSSTYDPENSPVRHKLTANVVYRNLKNGNAEDMGIEGAEISAGTRLPTPTAAANHKFVGWTTDISGKSAPYTVFPAGVYGEQTLYAVWEFTDGITVDASFAAKDNRTTAAYDDVTKIELIPTVTLNGGQSPNTVMQDGFRIAYTWKQDGKAVGTTGDTYSPLNVDDSGTYTYDFRLSSISEPLWFVDRSSDNSVKVTITPAPVSLRSFEVKRISDNSNTYFYGMELQDLSPEGSRFMNSSRADVAGTVTFDGNYKLDIKDAIIDESTGELGLQVGLKFTPTSNNYQSVTVNVFIYPQELPLNFELSYSANGTVDHILTTGLEYGNNNTAAKIASDFEAAYTKFLDDNQDNVSVMRSVAGKRPYIVGGVDGASVETPISLDDYKISGASIDKPTDAVTIKISLLYEEYDVTLDADNGVDDVVTARYGYGIRISQSDWPSGIVPTKTGNEFLGWFVTDADGNLTEEEWDPNTSRVTRNVSIKAKWFVQVLTLVDLEITGYDKEGVFVADTALKDGDLTVVAIYTGVDSKGEEVTVRKTLPLGGAGGYTLRYQNGNAPYVNAPEVTVTFADGKTITKTVTLEHVAKKKYEITLNSFRSVSYSVDDTTKKIPSVSSADMDRNTKLESAVTYTYLEGGVEIPLEEVDLTRQATYWITAHFTLRPQFQTNYYVEDIQVSLEIYAGKTTLTAKWDKNSLIYSGAGQHPTITLYLDGEVFVPSEDDGITIEYVVTGSNVTLNPDSGEYEAIIVGSYKVEARLTSGKYVLKDGTEPDEQLLYSFAITKAKLAKPTAAGELYYNGDAQSVTELLGTTYDPLLMNLTQQHSGTDAGTYRAGITLKDPRNSEWEDGSTTSVSISWQIKKQVLYATWNSTTVLLGQGSVPSVTALEGLIGDDQDVDLTSGVLVYSGTNTMPTEVGTYQISVRLNNAALSKNYTIDAPSSIFDFVVVPDESVIVIDVQWDASSFTFDGASHSPTASAVDMDGNPVAVTFTYSGDTSAKWAKDGGYSVTVSAPDGYYIRKGAECKYNIVANDEGKGGLTDAENPFNPSNNPGGGENPPTKPGDGTTDDNKPSDGFTLPKDMPWWQLGLGLLSVILSIVFTSKGAKYGSERKKCIKETTKVMAGSFASPVLLLTLFGLSNTVYTIVACALAGLMVLALIYMLVQKRRFVKAEAGLSKAQDERKLAEKREQEEKLFQQEEERRRRDEEFKMMMASMMNPNMQAQGGYVGGDIKEIVGDVVASLMPAMQQTMQALPAPDNSELRAVIEQQQQMIEQMMNNQQQLQALPPPDSGAEERIREMELRMAEQQRLAEERHAEQLAQQQAMMAEQQRLAEERMAQMMAQMAATMSQSTPQPQTVVQTDDGLRDILEKHGEILNDLMSKENVNNTVVINKEGREIDDESKVRLTLKEAYEKLTDPLKKVFDATGEYVMKNQEVVASEGKFAITYKYRGKQYLKLSIKRGYPTISYSTEGEQLRNLKKKAAEEEGVKVRFKMSELQIFDDSTLEVAKGVIDLRREQIDRDIELMKKKK